MASFSSMNTAVSGLRAAQTGLYVTGHNMSNVDMVGYTRQQALQVDFLSQNYGRNHISTNQVGLGTSVNTIRQHRNQFLDISYRKEIGRAGFYGAQLDVGREIETILGELEGEYRFDETIQDVWNILQELSVDHKSIATRGSFVQTIVTFINKANNTFDRFSTYQQTLNQEIKDKVKQINGLLTSVDELNGQIAGAEAFGDRANDYRDTRNNALDELGLLLNITYKENNAGIITIMAEGKELISQGYVAKLGLRYTGADSDFVEPVFTMSPDILSYDPLGKNAQSLFNYDQLIAPGRQNDGGELKGLLVARGLMPANYTSKDFIVPDYMYPNNTHPRQIFDMSQESQGARDAYALFLEDVKAYELSLQNYKHGMTRPDPPSISPAFIATLTDTNNINAANGYNTNLPIFIATERNTNLAIFQREKAMDQFNMENCLIPKLQMELDNMVHALVTMINNACAPSIWDGAKWIADPDAPQGMDGSQQMEIIVRKSDRYQNRYDALGNLISEDARELGSLYTIGNIEINPALLKAENYDKMAFSKSGDESDNRVFEDMFAQWESNVISGDGKNFFNMDSYYRHIMTKLATEVSQASSTFDAQMEVVSLTDQRRMSVSAVSMDEEMRNMMIFQHAYNASSRMVTVIDSMIDRIVNNTGYVGL